MNDANDNKDYYFISVGEKTYFYTLRYSYLDVRYFQNEDGSVESLPLRKESYIRNLSHDFDEAIQKAKEYYAKHAYLAELRLPKHPRELSERQLGATAALRESLETKILPTGKYTGSHVSDVQKDYVQWVVANLYEVDEIATPKNILAHICYNHAVETGWFDEWVETGKAAIESKNDADNVNSLINEGEILIGKKSGEKIEDFAFTKKKTIRANAESYLYWLVNQDTTFDKYDPELVTDADGNEVCIINSKYYENTESKTISKFDISVIIARQFLATYAEPSRNPNAKPRFKKYKYVSTPIILSDIEYVVESLKKRF